MVKINKPQSNFLLYHMASLNLYTTCIINCCKPFTSVIFTILHISLCCTHWGMIGCWFNSIFCWWSNFSEWIFAIRYVSSAAIAWDALIKSLQLIDYKKILMCTNLYNVHPAFLVEYFITKMQLVILFCLLYFLFCDNLSHQPSLDKVLKPKEHYFRKLSTSTFKVGIDSWGPWWILLVMGNLRDGKKNVLRPWLTG